ncbi:MULTISPECIES: formate transporter FocA [Desulfovibrio]|uniref:Formate transporter n=1 Tax=Desulfovibrio desulfuricans TaxID=876 RepID=A0AA94L2V9_DESDE|nr:MULTISPECIES: formate transporter FocA [Desulfovibrio]ATD80953.1 formate transporter FocA [Desulfovibrio sp. G11]SFW62259.1 formate transporter [Desulfovibrio desulfuricans]SPD36518.1 formate/nitrite transporter [Desulfovibrio sp. G11]
MHDPSSFEALNPQQMCHKAVVIMAGKALRPAPNAFMLAVMAGVFIGLGFVYCAVANTAGAGKIVGGLVFSLGLMLVIVLGADLFTSTTMTLLPRACRKITWGQMFSNWGIVYAGNFVGSLFLAALILLSGHPWASGGDIAVFYINTTENKLTHTFIEAIFLGTMCNLLVCLGVWMSYAGRSLIDKMAACLFPVGLFIACGFEHSVANMFMIPIGILCNDMMPPAVAARLTDPEHTATVLTWSNFIFKNLIPVTLGNILGGGVFVGMFHWLIYLRSGHGGHKHTGRAAVQKQVRSTD